MLGRLVDDCGKRMVGVTDGFDSSVQQSKIMLGIYAMLHEWFVEQLRSKVNRGMEDAFLAGRNVNLPALGQKLVPIIDQDGQPVCGADGKPQMVKVRDEEEVPHVEYAYAQFVEQLAIRSESHANSTVLRSAAANHGIEARSYR